MSIILFPRTFPFSTCAPVLIAFNTHLTDSSDRLMTTEEHRSEWIQGEIMAEITVSGIVRQTDESIRADIFYKETHVVRYKRDRHSYFAKI